MKGKDFVYLNNSQSKVIHLQNTNSTRLTMKKSTVIILMMIFLIKINRIENSIMERKSGIENHIIKK